MIERVTIHADASWSSGDKAKGKGKASGWGVWIRWMPGNDGKIVRAGQGPHYIEDNNEAELAAIFAGLHIVSLQPWFKDLKVIYIRSDSTAALHWLQNGVRQGHPGAQRLLDKIRVIKAQIPGCHFDVKHTPGHANPKRSIANYVNGQVDELSRQARLKVPS